MVSALEYVFGHLRQETLIAASVNLAATSKLGLVSHDVESTLAVSGVLPTMRKLEM